MDNSLVDFKLYTRQVKAVDAMVKAFDDGKDTIILGAPTGSGKSILAAELSRRLDCRVFVTTPLVTLVDQMYNDKKFHHLAGDVEFITGRNRWQCYRDPTDTVAEAVCKEIDANGVIVKDADGHTLGCRFKRWDPAFGMPQCAYYNKKAEAELARVVVTTLAYFLRGIAPLRPPPRPTASVKGWDFGRLSARDLLIVDEAHGLAEVVVSYLTTGWDQGSYTVNGTYHDRFGEWLIEKDIYRYVEGNKTLDGKDDVLADCIEGLRNLLIAYAYRISDLSSLAAEREIESLERETEFLMNVMADLRNGVPWVGKFEQNGTRTRFEIQPVLAGPHLKRAMWNRAHKIVLQSATWTDLPGTISDDGLYGRKIRYISMPSDFPPEFSPVFLLPVANLSRDSLKDGFPRVAEALFRIMAKEQGRGLVHTATFTNASWLEQLAGQELRKRLWIHRQGENREDLLRRFMRDSPKGTVLASPSMMEGVDLVGDMGEWAAIVKSPFPFLGDRRVARRLAMPDGRRWYEQQVIEDTIQACGRVVRGRTERANRYILDGNLVTLLRRWWFQLPVWFRDTAMIGETRAARLLGDLTVDNSLPTPTLL